MREYLDVEFKAEDVREDGSFSGYGSTFGGKPDSYGDVVVEGAFAETLANGGRNGFGIAMLWSHKTDQPIGVWKSLVENKKGLRVEGQLALGVQRGKETHELMKLGAVKGLSIGFDTEDGIVEFDDKKSIRYLKKVNLWEISPVMFPANIRANITNVKTLEAAKTPRELEAALRDSGLSIQASQYMVSLCKDNLSDSGLKGMDEVLSVLKNLNKNRRR